MNRDDSILLLPMQLRNQVEWCALAVLYAQSRGCHVRHQRLGRERFALWHRTVTPLLPAWPLKDYVFRTHVQSLLQQWERKKSYNTVRRYASVLQLLYKMLIDSSLIEHSSSNRLIPVSYMQAKQINKASDHPMLRNYYQPYLIQDDASCRRRDIFTHVEIDALYGAANKEGDRAMLLLLLTAGLRVGGVRSCRYRDFICDEQAVSVACTVEKGGRLHRFYVCRLLQNSIMQLRAKNPHAQYIFSSKRKKNDPVAIMTLQRRFTSLQRKAQLSKHYRWVHATRHTVAHALRLIGVPCTCIQAYLGHQCVQTTHFYGRLSAVDVAHALHLPWADGPKNSGMVTDTTERGWTL